MLQRSGGSGRRPPSPAQIAAYLALADAQPTLARRGGGLCAPCAWGRARDSWGPTSRPWRAPMSSRAPAASSSLSDTDGVPHIVPVLALYHERLLGAARDTGEGLLIGGASARRRNVTTHLTASLAGGADLARLDISRLRATWLCEAAHGDRAQGLHGRGRRRLLPAPRRPRGPPRAARRGRGRGALRRRPVLSTPALGRAEAVVDAWGSLLASKPSSPSACVPASSRCAPSWSGSSSPSATAGRPTCAECMPPQAGLAKNKPGRLGVSLEWRSGPHDLTYRQVERTFSLVVGVLAKANPDGAPSETLQEVLDALIEASVPESAKERVGVARARLDRRRVLLHPAHEPRWALRGPRGGLGASKGRRARRARRVALRLLPLSRHHGPRRGPRRAGRLRPAPAAVARAITTRCRRWSPWWSKCPKRRSPSATSSVTRATRAGLLRTSHSRSAEPGLPW